MKLLNWKLTIGGLSELDCQIEKLRKLRDSYRAANVAYYGKEIADLLNS